MRAKIPATYTILYPAYYTTIGYSIYTTTYTTITIYTTEISRAAAEVSRSADGEISERSADGDNQDQCIDVQACGTLSEQTGSNLESLSIRTLV